MSKLNPIPKLLLFYYIFIFISTEIFSYLNILTRTSIVGGEILFLILIVVFFQKDLGDIWQKIKLAIKTSKIIVILVTLTFIQGIFSAPNTTDSIVYHLPRVMYWTQEHSLYQDVIRNDHDFMAPFAEYILLHLYLIFQSDRALFLSQWLAFIVSIYLAVVVANQLGIKNKAAKLISLLIASLPIALMQSSSTQTDMVTTLMLLLSFYFALILRNDLSLKNIFFFSFAIGLGILTKATFIIYLIIPFAFLLPALKKWRQFLPLALISIVIIGLAQVRFLYQNLTLYGNITGVKLMEKGGGYINEIVTPQVIISNLVRNIFLHFPTPFFAKDLQSGITILHKIIGLDLNDARITYYDTKFAIQPVVFPQEDIVGNPIHLIIILLSAFLLFLHYKNFKFSSKVNLYILSVISFIIFSAILKWQPFHSRLQIPFFIFGSISSISILLDQKRFEPFLRYLVALSVALSIVLVTLNTSRPYISYAPFYKYVKSFAPPLSDIPQSFYTKERERQYFSARFYWYRPYKKIMEKATLIPQAKTVAFDLMDGFEYPLWMLMKKGKLNIAVIPKSSISKDTIIISTSIKPFKRKGYKVECVKTEIEYGYACLSVPNQKNNLL